MVLDCEVKVKEAENREKKHVKFHDNIKLNNTYLFCLDELKEEEKEKLKVGNLDEELDEDVKVHKMNSKSELASKDKNETDIGRLERKTERKSEDLKKQIPMTPNTFKLCNYKWIACEL